MSSISHIVDGANALDYAEPTQTGFLMSEGKLIDLDEERRKKTPLIEYSNKQAKVLTWWTEESPYRDYYAIIADGAVRSGKTASVSLSYTIWSMFQFEDTNFSFCGKTIGSLRRNVIEPLKKMLKGRKYRVIDRRGENKLIISTKINGRIKSNFYYLFGGQDESSQDLIQGITLGGIMFDEVALMPQSFVNQATARCSLSGAKLWFNCNPEGPHHYFHKEWIEKAEEKKCLYLHFTMDDNPSLSEETKDRYKHMYTGIFKKRFIDGLWVMADGVIFDMFNEDAHITKAPDDLEFWDELYVSCDYGTQNPTTFGLFGIKGGWVHQLRSYYYDGRGKGIQKTDGEYAEDMVHFLGNAKGLVKEIIVDPSAASFIAELRKAKYNLPTVIKAKNDVLNGIRTVQNFLAFGLFTMDPSCSNDIAEFGSYVWDEKAAKNGLDAPVKENDHCMDKIRYLIYTKFGIQTVVKYSEEVYNKGKVLNPYKDILRRSKGVI